MTITTGNFPKAQALGVTKWFGASYDAHKKEYPDLYELDTSERAYEELVETTGFPVFAVKPQGAAAAFSDNLQGIVNRAVHVAYARGFIITWEEKRDNLYEQVGKARSKQLAYSANQTIEIVAADMYNDGFTGGPTFGDGVSFLNSSHPTRSGNQSNILSVAAPLSEASIEDLCTDIMDAKDSVGNRISLMPQSLHVPTALIYEANRILKSSLQSNSAENNINALRADGTFPKGIKVNHYFDSTTAWFIRTNAPAGPTMFVRDPLVFGEDNDFDTKNDKFLGYMRHSFIFGDWRSVFGTAGA
jgi:hypothetical protein